MEFRMIYGGLSLGASRTNTRSEHKHDIRRVFHQQLKQLFAAADRASICAREEVESKTQRPNGDGLFIRNGALR